MKIKLSNELQPAELEPVMREPKPNRFRQAVDVAKNVGMGAVGAGAAVIDAAKNLKVRQDLKTI